MVAFPFNFIIVQAAVLIFFLYLLLLLGTANLDQSHLEDGAAAVKASSSYVDAIKYYAEPGTQCTGACASQCAVHH